MIKPTRAKDEPKLPEAQPEVVKQAEAEAPVADDPRGTPVSRGEAGKYTAYVKRH